jgi:hypothetical protein
LSIIAGWRRGEGLAEVRPGNAPGIVVVIEVLW